MIADLCPTGRAAIPLAEMRSMPAASWFAMNRHDEHTRRHPLIASIFEEGLADIEVSGLLKQAETALGGPSALPQNPRN